MIDWAGFVPAAVLVSLIPGANQLLGLSNAVRYGPSRALAGLGGRLAAFVVLVALVVAGLGAALVASAAALEVIRWVGVAYLLWLGVVSIRSAIRYDPSRPAVVAAGGRGTWTVVGREFAVAISNPKALLLFAALLPQFTAGPVGDTGRQIVLLGLAYLLVELVVGLGYIAVGTRLGATGIPGRVQRRVDFASGGVFIGLATLLAVDDLG